MSNEHNKAIHEIADHLRIVEKLLRAIEHLGHAESSCDHTLVRDYALQAMGHLQAAQRWMAEQAKGD